MSFENFLFITWTTSPTKGLNECYIVQMLCRNLIRLHEIT